MSQHSPVRMFLIILAFLTFIATCVINVLSSSVDTGLFVSSTGNVSDKYWLEITPAGWTFSIWGMIYAYQAIWLIYALSTLFTKTNDGYLYVSPALLPPTLFIFYILNLGCNITWLFAFDREWLAGALGVLAAVTFTAYACIGFTMYSVNQNATDLIREGKRRHVIFAIAFVINGIGLYAAWVSIATLLNLAIVLTYVVGIEQTIASSISLGILAFDVVVYSWVDMMMLESHFRYLYTPYITLHMALAGSVSKNWDYDNPNSIFTAALICCGSFVFIGKVITSIVRTFRDPLYSYGNVVKPTTSKMNESSIALVHCK